MMLVNGCNGYDNDTMLPRKKTKMLLLVLRNSNVREQSVPVVVVFDEDDGSKIISGSGGDRGCMGGDEDGNPK